MCKWFKKWYGKHRTHYTCVVQFWVTCMCFSLQRCLSNTKHLVDLNTSLIFLGHSRHLLNVAFPVAIYSAWNALPISPIKLTQIFTKMSSQWGIPWHTTKIESPSQHSLFSFFLPHFFSFLVTLQPYGILSIFSFISLFILPPTRMFIPRGQRFFSSLFIVLSPMPKSCLDIRDV